MDGKGKVDVVVYDPGGVDPGDGAAPEVVVKRRGLPPACARASGLPGAKERLNAGRDRAARERALVKAASRSPARDIARALNAQLDSVIEVKGMGRMSRRELLAAKMVVAAMRGVEKGDGRMAQMVLDRAEGKVPDRVAGHDGGPVQVDVFMEMARKVYGDEAAVEVEARVADGGAA